MFADDASSWGAWAGLVLPALTVAGGGVAWLLTWLAGRKKTSLSECWDTVARKDAEMDAMRAAHEAEVKALHDNYERRIARLEAAIDDQQRVIGEQRADIDDCFADRVELWSAVSLARGLLLRVLSGEKISPDEAPPLPPRPRRDVIDRAAHAANETEFNRSLVKGPPEPGKGDAGHAHPPGG